MKNKIINILAITTIFSSSLALAQVLTIPKGQTSGEFSCTSGSVNPFTKITIDTKSIEINGFCAGEPHVVSDGHVANLPNSELNEHYFEFKKQINETGTITITSSSDASLSCSIGRDGRNKSYGNGKYC